MTVTKRQLLQFAFDDSVKEHAELWDAWKITEAKAQTSLSTAGVFIAGAFAYATQSKPVGWEKIFLVLLVLSLVVSAAFGIASIWVKSVSSPHLGRAGHQDILSLIEKTSLPQTLADSYEDLLNETVKRWNKSNDKVRAELVMKANRLKWCQASLAIGLFIMLPLVIFTMLKAT